LVSIGTGYKLPIADVQFINNLLKGAFRDGKFEQDAICAYPLACATAQDIHTTLVVGITAVEKRE
jgi:hypothetical protein